jgi:hypothetical protein
MFDFPGGSSASAPSWHDMQKSLPSMTPLPSASANDAGLALHADPLKERPYTKPVA